MLKYLSFRQLLVAAFLLIAALLAGVSLHALVALEHLTLQSRVSATHALESSTAVQALAERSIAMERSARVSLVLTDLSQRKRFDETAADARNVLARLASGGVPKTLLSRWNNQVAAITALLQGSPDTAPQREQQVTQAFRKLDGVNAEIDRQVRYAIAAQNTHLIDSLELRRRQLTQQVIGATALAVLLALAFGVLLTRPLNRLNQAIIDLGENRLDQAMAIAGPADLQRLGLRLDWLRLRLVELDADKSRFLRHISHELKTPLAALREGVSLLEDGVAGVLSESQQEVAHILHHNTDLLQAQIEDLLRFNTAAFEARQLRRERVDLLQLIEEQVEGQQLQWRARDLSVVLEGQAPPVEADRDKLGTVMGNLLSNAVRYSPVGGVVRIVLSQVASSVQIDFCDAGPGVAPGDRARIFEPFYRGERQPLDAAHGSGIGLSIVHEYITAHGGRVQLLQEGPGAHFRIELPHVITP